MKSLHAFVLLALLLAPTLCFAQVKVYVSSTSDDTVGRRLVYAVKEGIRRSSSMSVVDLEADALIGINIVTLDPDQDTPNSNNRTIYSLVWTTKTFHETPVTMYLSNYVGLCGSRKVEECGDTLVAETDTIVSRVRGWILEAAKSKN